MNRHIQFVNNASLCTLSIYTTVEQEISATGKFREFALEAIRVQEIFANFELPTLNVPKQNLGPPDCSRAEKFREFAKIREIRKNFLHAKICCSTVS